MGDRTATASPLVMSSASAASMNTGQPPKSRGTGEVPEAVSKDGRLQMHLRDSKEVIRQKIVQPRQATLGETILQPVLQQQQHPQLKLQRKQQMHCPEPTNTGEGPESRHHAFLQSCSPAEVLQGRMTSPKLQYREAGVKRQQSAPNRGIDHLLKLWDQNLNDATRGMERWEDRPQSITGMSETPCSLNSSTFLGGVGSTAQTCAAKNMVETPECGTTRRKDFNESDVMSVSTRSCTDDGEASSVKRCSALSVLDMQEEECVGALFFDLAADDLDEDEADFFPAYGGLDHMGKKSNT